MTPQILLAVLAVAGPPSSPETELDFRRLLYEGKACERETKMAGAPDPTVPVRDGPPPAEETQATEAAVFLTCGGLACIDDPDSDVPTDGVCGLAVHDSDCGGVGKKADGSCNAQHERLHVLEGFRPHRFMFTGFALVDSDTEDARGLRADLLVGVLYQLALSTSRVARLPDGTILHTGLPEFYAHGSAFLDDDRGGLDLGLVYKTGWTWITRLGLTAVGLLERTDDWIWRAGPALQVEVYSNLIVKGGALPIGTPDAGPRWFVGVEYAAGLWDDFKKTKKR